MSLKRIVVVLPRGRRFGPDGATAIDLCVRDFAMFSRFRAITTIVGEPIPTPFAELDFRPVPRAGAGFQLLYAARLADVACRLRPDLVIVHQHIPSAVRIAKKLKGVPVLLHRHNGTKARKGKSARALELANYALFAGTIWVSDFCLDQFCASHPSLVTRAHRVHNGLDFAHWCPATRRDQEILFVGRMAWEKGCVEAAEAIARVLVTHPNWRAKFILARRKEDPAYAIVLQQAIASAGDRVTVEFDATHDRVKEAFSKASIALVPSQHEPFGRTAIEAFAGGAALITSMRDGLREVAEGFAEAADPPNAENIAAALERLISNPARLASLAQAGRLRGEQAFDIRKSAAQLDDIYERAVPVPSRSSKLAQNASTALHAFSDRVILSNMRDAHLNETLFLIGSGPSLRHMDLGALKASGRVFMTVNNGHRLFSDCTIPMHAVSDIACYETFGAEIETAPIRQRFYRARFRATAPYQVYGRNNGAIFVPYRRGGVLKRGVQLRAELGLGNDASVLIFATQLGYHLGFSTVFVLGCDLDYAGPATYAYDMTAQDLTHENSDAVRRTRPAMANANAEFAALRVAFEAGGRRLINAGVGGKLDSLPRLPFEQALALT